ncbi:hypothetical protein M885DRAFT_528075 [Pelagophyceae sp. CCMP2097]|nr:hypothetical protein M885DRAFT_528075 [Pelagophyceae sp. CCMP2097]
MCPDAARRAELERLCDAGDADGVCDALQAGGLPQDLRARAWACVLRADAPAVDVAAAARGDHAERTTVERDVARALWRFDATKGWSSKLRQKRRRSLARVIHAAFARAKGSAVYYQGFHDVAEVALLVAGFDRERRALALAEALLAQRFGDAAKPSGFGDVSTALRLLAPLLFAADAELAGHVFADREGFELVEGGIWGLAWVLTWFAHDVDDVDQLAQIWDALLAGTRQAPAFALYVAVALVVDAREDLLRCARDDDGGAPLLFQKLSRLAAQPRSPEQWNVVLANARRLLGAHPPSLRLCNRLPRPMRPRFVALADQFRSRDGPTVHMLRSGHSRRSRPEEARPQTVAPGRRRRRRHGAALDTASTKSGPEPHRTGGATAPWSLLPSLWGWRAGASAGVLLAGAAAALASQIVGPEATEALLAASKQWCLDGSLGLFLQS